MAGELRCNMFGPAEWSGLCKLQPETSKVDFDFFIFFFPPREFQVSAQGYSTGAVYVVHMDEGHDGTEENV